MSNLIGKFIDAKNNQQNTMTQWVRSVRDLAGVASEESDEEDELVVREEDMAKERKTVDKYKNEDQDDVDSLDMLLMKNTSVKGEEFRPFELPTQVESQTQLDSGSDEDEEDEEDDDVEVEVVQVLKGPRVHLRDKSEEPQVVKVTPPKKKRKKEEDEVSLVIDYKTTRVIHACACPDGASVLTTIPGGFIGHWVLPSYIAFLHKQLRHEMCMWIGAVVNFVKHVRVDAGRKFFAKQHKYVLDIVEGDVSSAMEATRNVTTSVLHSMDDIAIQSALRCKKPIARLVYSFCKSMMYRIKFHPNTPKRTYDIGTVFGDGSEWRFGKCK